MRKSLLQNSFVMPLDSDSSGEFEHNKTIIHSRQANEMLTSSQSKRKKQLVSMVPVDQYTRPTASFIQFDQSELSKSFAPIFGDAYQCKFRTLKYFKQLLQTPEVLKDKQKFLKTELFVRRKWRFEPVIMRDITRT